MMSCVWCDAPFFNVSVDPKYPLISSSCFCQEDQEVKAERNYECCLILAGLDYLPWECVPEPWEYPPERNSGK